MSPNNPRRFKYLPGPDARRACPGKETPPPQVAANVDWAVLIVRIEPMADDSLADCRARNSAGIAIAAMMPMIATTMSSSISVKPSMAFAHLVSRRLDAAPDFNSY